MLGPLARRRPGENVPCPLAELYNTRLSVLAKILWTHAWLVGSPHLSAGTTLSTLSATRRLGAGTLALSRGTEPNEAIHVLSLPVQFIFQSVQLLLEFEFLSRPRISRLSRALPFRRRHGKNGTYVQSGPESGPGHREIGKNLTKTAGDGGEGGIRTPDGLAPMPHFECGAFNHSATSPRGRWRCSSAAGS